MSRGKQKFGYAKAVRKNYDDYQAQIAKERKKAKKRSLWSSIGAIVGTIVAVVAAPFTGGTSLAMLGNALLVGGAAYAGGHAGKEASEAEFDLGFIEGGAERDDITVDRFYESDAEAANEAFKDFDEDIVSNIESTAMWAAIGSGVMSSGVLSKAAGKLGLGSTSTAKGATALTVGGKIVPPALSTAIKGGVGTMAAKMGLEMGLELYKGPQSENYGFDRKAPTTRDFADYSIA